ncbi:longitudinals lacking protein, isoforms A/B/D/L-like isoform X7 [Aphis craccivora]|uniref:Longitudinals lacking protein, isoforms A/B/D/L-like isoform X7 n=1 Tax=Aphis craccivora TaxID=307492 RepID=A0A6G0YGT8_APHCR|nr:longitudinals lacking protein, isoforms A/B/D/L-like isoform X7 [Aphis craccivora]
MILNTDIIILIFKFLLLPDKPWMCLNNCGRTYLNKKSLIRHLRYECGVKRQFQCSMCFHQFKLHVENFGIASLQKVMLMNTNNCESKVRFFCLNMCGRSYKNKQHMTRHMTSECGVQPKFQCQYCKKCFTRIVQIYCPKCNNIYENNKSLFTHLMYECASDERKFQCNICLIKFSQLHLLKCHMLSQHKAFQRKVESEIAFGMRTQSRQFANHNWPCPQDCGRSYKHKHSLANHLKYECGVQPQFVCKNCTRHFFNHKWPCPQNCGRSYKNKHSLASHLKYECGVQPQFICKNCTRTFKLKHHLKSHTMSCDNVPPEFSCPFCNKLFRQKVHLKTHIGCVHKLLKTLIKGDTN